MIREIVFVDDLPADGEPPSALETVVPGALFTKRNGYNAVDLAVTTETETVSLAVYRYNRDFKGWRPEGPRGTTPTSFAPVASPISDDNIPIRISVPVVEEFLCVVSETDEDTTAVQASLSEANR